MHRVWLTSQVLRQILILTTCKTPSCTCASCSVLCQAWVVDDDPLLLEDGSREVCDQLVYNVQNFGEMVWKKTMALQVFSA